MDAAVYLRFFLVLVLVLGLIVGLAWLLKRFGFGEGTHRGLARRRRLATIESTALDSRHKAVLMRRDDVEHLVLIGPNTSQIIEAGIPATGEMPDRPSSPLNFGKMLSKD
jgi:flagellar protein FliO/FliZ